MNTSNPYKPIRYFTITFLTTYVLWFAGAYISFQDKISDLYMLLMLPGLIAPFVISLVMVRTSGTVAMKKDFIDRLFNLKRIQWNRVPVMLVIMPLSVIVSITLSLLFGESTNQFHLAEEFSFSSGFIPVLLLLLTAATFEELGWRGYAFDSLQSRFSGVTTSLVFGVLWSAWHLPLLYVKDSYQYEIAHQNIWYAVNFFISIIPMGVIISWVCLINKKSVIAAIVFHFIINISQEALGMTSLTKCIQTIVLTAFAVIIVAKEKELFSTRRPDAFVPTPDTANALSCASN